MGRHAPLVRKLADRLRGKELTSLVYFHADHFEPWRPVGGAAAMGPETVDAVHDFCRTTERMDFARRLTLFYKPQLNYALRRGDGLVRAHADDLVGFVPRAESEERAGREAMREVALSSAHDIQLHMHHEYYTATTAHTDPEAVAWFGGPLGKSLDGQRLELAIRLNRDIIERETGRRSARWFFVHGHWALNGSDDTSCTITNEIDILLRNGCHGDFTFPAGRAHTNPRIKVPYLCRPFDKAKAYDLAECEPEVACGNASAARSKFFIWASPANSVQCSLDYMAESSRRQLEDTDKAASELIDNAYVADGRLFIKTHAHSMHPFYFEHSRMAVFPHQYPPTQTLLSVIFEAAAEAGIAVQFLTVPEVYDLLVTAKAGPSVDLAATYLRRSGGLLQDLAKIFTPRPAARRQAVATGPVLEAAPALALVRDTAAAVLDRRIAELGVDGSGAHKHYAEILEQGFPIPTYELAALDIVRREIPRDLVCHEIGAGIGVLSFLLALDGFSVVALEQSKARHETARVIWSALSSKVDVSAADCRLRLGRFPAAVAPKEAANAVAIVTNLVSTQTPRQVRAIMSGLLCYRYVLIDLERFVVLRRTPEEREVLLNDLLRLGFEVSAEPDEADGALVLLRNLR